MIKADFVEKVAERTGLSKLLVKVVVDSFLDSIREALFQETRIELRNFGVFQVKKRKPIIGRNPRTGEKVEVPERLKVTFKPSRVFKKK
ncbi:MAG: integration host factor subunit beta [Candidatus Omnitrophica bacterium]|nr:integration host factor subunit beta [Candidatus Omnitrophota bacterium]MCM8769718.1 integration host factor subunit beta [Candidatus Omnitrophota bacterium]